MPDELTNGLQEHSIPFRYKIAFSQNELALIPQQWLKSRQEQLESGGFTHMYVQKSGSVTWFQTNNAQAAMFLIALSSGGIAEVEWMEEALGVSV